MEQKPVYRELQMPEKKRNIIQKKDGKKYDHQNIEILETSKLIYKGRT